MNKTISSKSYLIICVLGLVLWFSVLVLGTVLILDSVSRENNAGIIVGSCMACFCTLALIFNAMCLNFIVNRVYYNNEKNQIIAQGLICGYKRCIDVDNIKDIEIQFNHWEDHNYVIIEKKQNNKKPIKLAKTPQNERFIKQFWDKPITDTRDSIWRLG